MRDILFLLRPGFLDGDARYFCPGSAQVEGVLSFYPKLREQVDVRYIAYPRPRAEVVALLGPQNQGAPALVLADAARAKGAPAAVGFREHDGRLFVNEPLEIAEYLAWRYGSDRPH